METEVSTTRNRILLSNTFWKFAYGLNQKDSGEDPGITQKWYETGIPSGHQKMKVYVPSSWSYYENRKNFYHFGTGWYENLFFMPEGWGSGEQKITLVFSGSNYKTILWLNGQYVGTHEGGFTKFWFEINDFVKFGTDNLLIVQVDNRYQDGRIPWYQSPDWMNYGGIYRPVYLKLTEQVCIDDFKCWNTIQFDQPPGLGYKIYKPKLHMRCLIKDFRKSRRNFEGFITVTLKSMQNVQTTEIPFKLENKGEELIELELEVSDCNLWSPDEPYLYNLTIQLLDKNRKEHDRDHWRWGFREITLLNNQFLLNNRPIILRGVNHHEDHPEVGNSMSPRLSYNDLNIMKSANINCIRTSHYPPYESFMDMADEMGFLVLEEIPVWGLQRKQFSTSYLINAQTQLWEMINRDKNHTCVFAWSIAHECETNVPEAREFIKSLLEIGRELDPTRYFTLVTNRPLADATLDLLDFICVNLYAGWNTAYDMEPKDVQSELEKIWDRIQHDPDVKGPKPLVISEFGAEAIAGFKDFANPHWSENYQYQFMKDYIKLFIDRPYIAGAIIWHFQDFRVSPFKAFLDRPQEYNNTGIVDMHRNPKISYYIVQSLFGKWKDKIERIK